MGRKGRTSIPLLRFDGRGAGIHVDLDRLVASRLMIQANSGGGKSWALRYLLEQTFGQVPHLVLDSEGEFMTLRERFPYVLAGKGGDVAVNPKIAKHTARRLVEVGASAVIDLYELRLHERREYVRLFVNELLSLPRKLWTPYLVILDEAHKYAPEGGKSECREEVVSLCSQGRKRGLCPILATQRLSKLAKDAAAELANKMIGRTGLDLDMKRAADELGLDRAGRQGLKDLIPGTFYVYGPAIEVGGVSLVQTGDVETTHPEPGKVAATPPPAPAEVASVLEQLQDLEREAEEEERTIETQAKRIRELEAAVRRAEASAPEPERIVEEVEVAVPAVDEEQLAELIEVHGELRDELPRLTETMAGVGHALEDFNDRSDRLIRELEGLKNGRPSPSPRTGSRPIESDQARSARAPAPTRALPRSPRSSAPADTDLPKGEHAILTAIAQHPEGATLEQLSVITGYKRSSRNTYLQRLRSRDYVEKLGDQILVTQAGLDALGSDFEPLPTGRALLEHWRTELPEGERRVLDVVVAAYPDTVEREAIDEETGYKRSSRNTYLQRLSSRKLVDTAGQGEVRAADILFD